MFSVYCLSVDEFIVKHKIQAKALKKSQVIKDIHRIYELVDSKSSSLLTCLALIIAICIFVFNSPHMEPVPSIKNMFMYAAIGYLFSALLLLPCLGLSMYDAPKRKKELKTYYARSCRTRVRLYISALTLTGLITLFVLATILCRGLC